MSFDLCVFYTTKPHSDAQALKRNIAFCEESDLSPYIETSPKIGKFVKELTARYPQIDDVPEDKLDDCPWSIAFDVSDGHVIMPMVWSKADQMAKIIIELAEANGLVCVDPQSDRIVTAPVGIRVQAKPFWKFW